MNQGELNIDGTNIKLYIIIVAVIVSSVISFYIGTKYQGLGDTEEENLTLTLLEIEQNLEVQNTTIFGLNNEIRELNEQLIKYDQLEEAYNQLNWEYESLSIELNELRTDYNNIHSELDMVKDQIRGDDFTFTLIVGNLSFTLPQRYIVYASGLYDSTATMNSGILSASTVDDNTLISFSWDTLVSEPDLTKTLDNSYNSIGLVLEYEMYQQLEVEDRNLVYSYYKTILENEYAYINIATWYEEDSMKQYICIVQNTANNVNDILQEFVSGFKLIP